MNRSNIKTWIQAWLLGAFIAGILVFLIIKLKPHNTEEPSIVTPEVTLYDVISVIDGDTFKINYEGNETSVRLIGVNTPETVDPRTTVECFGVEASEYLKQLISGKKVRLEVDETQTDRDKYDRLLRYAYLDDADIALSIITNGYGYEYTYNIPYLKQTEYKKAQEDAEKNKSGLWGDGVCSTSSSADAETNQPESNQNITETQTAETTDYQPSTTDPNASSCLIKGNINSKGEKIYHTPGQKYYDSTKINTENGERWFCTEEEAVAAGWRKSKV